MVDSSVGNWTLNGILRLTNPLKKYFVWTSYFIEKLWPYTNLELQFYDGFHKMFQYCKYCYHFLFMDKNKRDDPSLLCVVFYRINQLFTITDTSKSSANPQISRFTIHTLTTKSDVWMADPGLVLPLKYCNANLII